MNGSVIFGSGQAGMAMYRLMQRKGCRVAAFGDNKKELWGSRREGLPVWSLEQVIEASPEEVCIAIINPDSSAAVRQALLDGGYEGRITEAGTLKETYSIRLATCRLLAAEIARREIPGAVAELGVYRGEFAAELNRLFPDRRLYLYDTFTGFDGRDLTGGRDGKGARTGDFSDTSAELVMGRMICPEQVILRPGYFPGSLSEEDEKERYALVSLDADLYQPMMAGLSHFYPRLSPGGYMILDDYNSPQFPGAGEAVREFCDREGNAPVPLCDIHGTAILTRQGERV